MLCLWQHTFRWLDSDVLKRFFVSHWQYNGLHQLWNVSVGVCTCVHVYMRRMTNIRSCLSKQHIYNSSGHNIIFVYMILPSAIISTLSFVRSLVPALSHLLGYYFSTNLPLQSPPMSLYCSVGLSSNSMAFTRESYLSNCAS